ncbi:hypothetical protein ACWT_5569 [Actinoplanes sp. SE50]|uniref:hypothetical protein n=1 Tax=unclassified Actinoplanes TaxID=2626549 RepID=UPI00023ECD4B|nr:MULTISPECIES: hypothetical protein [unclassified Actinoplanes]AEV86586.1 hypothetical protein ACPL_5699 [Actinoplanes sp. SE50/110]ATO84984.1 hypothetical protein ACWT_5569 [Actinoplanes sp. SE50]SLM02393.1 hypothetical protein ACSP50_5642 [Actinoplanes sp. SE50/110]
MTDLERRYARLIHWCYPAAYRRARGTEILGTYLDSVSPDRRRPTLADTVDLVTGGLRERVRACGLADLAPGFRLAGTFAMITATALAAGWSVVELVRRFAWDDPRPGTFTSIGILVWASWLLASVVHVAAPARWARPAVIAALLITVGIAPLADLLARLRPPLFVLLPQAALGLLALAGAGRGRLAVRLLPAAAAAAITATALAAGVLAGPYLDPFMIYYRAADHELPAAGTILLTAALATAFTLSARGDHRGAQALLALPAPIALLAIHPLTAAITGTAANVPNPTWSSMAAVAVLVIVAALTVLLIAATALRHRTTAAPPARPRCPTCGANRPAGAGRR